ncbi:MAG TPA: heterodisulfide reductase-related iron-sulfur binding cluster [Fimbriimonadaceae bacterium]|nr:heterodisulfide reductase-related iron-sulfur binding cluster [Fimbriimonadaceae bacterium]
MEPTRVEFMHMPAWQQTLFYILAFASLGVMFLQIGFRMKVWKQGKPIDWKPLGLRGIVKYVLAQRKVRSSRPKSGAPMHLMIFYGFLALTLATTLLAVNTYSGLDFHRGTYFLVYELTFDILGLVFVIGCAWALMRRLSFRPKSATHFASDTWAIALLLAIGLTGFILEGARIGNIGPRPHDVYSPVGYAAWTLVGGASNELYLGLWWFHAALVFTLFIILPRLRIRHLVMAILNSYGTEEQPLGELKPISLEEVEQTGQIGVSLPKDYSRWHLMSLDACMECGRCTEVCPAHNVGKILNPKKVVQDLRGAMVGGTSVAEAVSEEALWACTTCNACVEACPVLIRHVDMIVDARRHLIAEGKFAGTGATMLRQVGSTSHAWGQPSNSREEWMKDLDIPLCRNGVEFDILLWVGCAGATDPGAVKTTKAVAQLFKKAGVKFACLGQEEACTGDPARRTGDEFLFQEKAQTNVSVFEKYGVKRIVTPCPHCFNTFKNEYGQFDGNIEVEHHTQFLARLVGEGKLKSASAEGTTLHDPCYLGRINNEADAPRKLLGESTNLNKSIHPHRQTITLQEAEQFARKTLCCGAGGGRMWMEEPPEQRPGNRRAKQLLATGAKTVAVACPFCRIMLDASIKGETDQEIRLVDLAEMLAEVNS